MKLRLEEEGLYLANDAVVLLNMGLGVLKRFERGEEGFALIPRGFLSAPSVLVVEDGGLKKYYVVVSVGERDVEVLRVSRADVYANVAAAHVMALVSAEAPFGGADKEKAIAYLRGL